MDGTKYNEVYRDEQSDSLKDTSNIEMEEDDTSDIDNNEEFLAFYDVYIL